MLEEIKINDEYFLNYFFAYREDVDLAWRAQHRGWQCLYYPEAIAYHVRNNTPLKRDKMSNLVNMHSVKNRLLLLIQNETKYGLVKDGFIFLTYDLMILTYVFFRERSSLKGFSFIFTNFSKILEIRKKIQSTSCVNEKSFVDWFGRKQSEKILKGETN